MGEEHGDEALGAFFLSDDGEEVLRAARLLVAASAGRVTSPEGLNARTGKPERGGLFCARIFGPIEDDRCLCGALAGAAERGQRCSRCGVLCGASAERARRWAHIESPVALVHPVLHAAIAARAGYTAAELERVLARKLVIAEDGSLVAPDGYDGVTVELAARLGDDAGMLTAIVPVTPAGRRAETSAETDRYRRLVDRCSRMGRLLELNAPDIILRNEARLLHGAFVKLVTVVREELIARARQRQPPSERTHLLLAAVLAHPEDDDARAVLADHLLELGDPRGDFITLQRASASGDARMSPAEAVLLRRHQAEWLGPLGEVVDAQVKFRRGFLVRCRTLPQKRDEVRQLVGDAAWATVEHLGTDVVELLVDPCLRSLTSIGVSFATLLALCRLGRPLARVTSATVRLSGCPPRGAAEVVASDILPDLEQLMLIYKRPTGDPSWDWLFASPWARRLRRIHVVSHIERCRPGVLEPWAAFVQRAGDRLEEVLISFGQRNVVFGLRRRGDEVHLEVSLSRAGAERLSLSAELLGHLADALTHPRVAAAVASVAVCGEWFALSEHFQALAARLRAAFPAVRLPARAG